MKSATKRRMGEVIAMSAAFALSGCSIEAEEDRGVTGEAEVCGPWLDGVYPMMANLAITVGNELKRFEATTDMAFVNNRVRLTSTAYDRCDDLGLPGCENVKGILDMQEAPLIERNGRRLFDPVQYQQQLRVYLERQKIAEQRPCNQADSAWCATHEVDLDHVEPGVCVLDYWYEINVLSCSGSQCDVRRLSTKLIFAGYPENGYLHPTYRLYVSPPQVGIDPPLIAMVEGAPLPLVGSCINSPVVYDPPHDHLGACCVANGVPGTLIQASWNVNTLYCKPS
ncbi:MAG: hypothetical protein JW751_15605 [Polyangiaceae bacterium]|nr:hypothetical protein [Polyangiaceae bacterium]